MTAAVIVNLCLVAGIVLVAVLAVGPFLIDLETERASGSPHVDRLDDAPPDGGAHEAAAPALEPERLTVSGASDETAERENVAEVVDLASLRRDPPVRSGAA